LDVEVDIDMRKGIQERAESYAGQEEATVAGFLQCIKAILSMKTPSVHSIPCKCGEVYITKTNCSIETRIKEHHWYMQL
jgi:hypothetical protein